MYEQISSNKRRSAFLIFAFVVLVAALGWVFGELSGFGPAAVVVSGIASGGMVFTSYFWSDKIVLKISHAKPADPIQHRRLVNLVEGLSIAAGIQPPRTYVVEDSAPNAFATGRDPKHAAIAVTTGLLEKMNRVELEGVLAHELAHVVNRDVLTSSVAVVLAGMIVLMSDWMLRGFWRVGSGDRRRGGGAPIAILGLAIAILAPIIAQLLKFAVSRRREYLADSSGIMLTRYPPGLVSALKKLQADSTVVRTSSHATAHLWIESPLQRDGGRSWWNRMFDTHPPLEERIRVLETM